MWISFLSAYSENSHEYSATHSCNGAPIGNDRL
jgi:hypothetical protein